MLGEGTPTDTIIHLATAAIALILLGLSVISYRRTPRPRLLYVCGAFLIFALKEALVVIDVLLFQEPGLVFASHILNLFALILFFAGVMSE